MKNESVVALNVSVATLLKYPKALDSLQVLGITPLDQLGLFICLAVWWYDTKTKFTEEK